MQIHITVVGNLYWCKKNEPSILPINLSKICNLLMGLFSQSAWVCESVDQKKHICLVHFFPSVSICNSSACIRWENRLKAPFSILFKEAPSLFTRNPHTCIVALFVNHADSIQKQIEWIFTYCQYHHSFKK